MTNDAFWTLEHCTNGELLDGLESIVRSCRQRTAELVAHLGEVEARRLHLEAACSSMFDYCVKRLGLSEDEACRRIDVARLARHFPALFPRLASGEISLTVAAALKPYLAEENQVDVIACVVGTTVQQARERLAALFPRPDVATSIRKLPERRGVPMGSTDAMCEVLSSLAPEALATPSLIIGGFHPASTPTPAVSAAPVELSASARKAPPPIEPLSEARYRVQFTAGACLKEKLDQARDLMRHRNPSGDLAPIVERALELLLEHLMRERFGAAKQPRSSRSTTARHVSNATRRAVLERDGLQCSWVDTEGRRCESRAWLELDHRHPRAKGGSSEPDNIRVLCRSHNRLAAEQEYGRHHVEAAIAGQRYGKVRSPDLDAGVASDL